MTETVTAVVMHRFARASAEAVYDAWLNEADARAWQALALRNLGLAGEITRVEIDPREGGRFLFADLRDGVEARHWGTFRELNRPTVIEFTWFTEEKDETQDVSVVRLEIRPEESGCTVTLTHTLDAKYAEYLGQTENGWKTILQAVDHRCAGRDSH